MAAEFGDAWIDGLGARLRLGITAAVGFLNYHHPNPQILPLGPVPGLLVSPHLIRGNHRRQRPAGFAERRAE